MAIETTTQGLKLVNRGTVENDLEADTVYDFAGYHNDNMKVVNKGLEDISTIESELEDIQDSGIANNILYGGTFASQVITIEVTDAEAVEGSVTNTGTFIVKRNLITNSALVVDLEHIGTTVNYTTNPTTAKVGIGGTVTISSNMNTATVTVIVANNEDKEGDKKAVIRIKPVVDGRYVVGGPSIGTIIIKDND